MAGVEIQAEIGGGDDLEQLPVDFRGAHQVLSAGPLIRAEEHGAVLDGDLHAALLGQSDDVGPDLPEQLDVLFEGLMLILADKGGDHVYAQLGGSPDDGLQVGNRRFPLFQVRVHGVGIEGQRRNLQSLGRSQLLDIVGVGIVLADTLAVNVAHTGVAAFRFARGPAGYLQAFEAHLGGDVHNFLKAPSVQNGGEQTEFHHNGFLLICFRGFPRPFPARKTAERQTRHAWQSGHCGRRSPAPCCSPGCPSTGR